MRITIKTRVKAPLKLVKENFNDELFSALNPPFPKARLKEYGGEKTGDRVCIELDFFLFKQEWISVITDDFESKEESYFVDEGMKLPFFLSKWQHKHGLKSLKDGTLIIDAIRYSSGSIVLDLLLYPLMLGQFLYRKPVYKKFFNQTFITS